MHCPKCGTENPKWKDFCYKCGTRLEKKVGTPQKKEPEVVEPKREYRTPDQTHRQRSEPSSDDKPEPKPARAPVRPPGYVDKSEQIPEQPKPARKPVRPPGFTGKSKKSVNADQFLKTLPDKYTFLQKVPGFRSRTPWKMISSSIVSLILAVIIISTVSGLLTNHIPTYQLDDSSIAILGNNSTSENGYAEISAQILNNKSSSVSVLPVQVYYKDQYIGDFFLSNISPNQEITFNLSIPENTNTYESSYSDYGYSSGYSSSSSSSSTSSSSDSKSVKVEANGKSVTFNYAGSNSSSYSEKYSTNPGDYKLVIGNQSAEISKSILNNMAENLIGSYNSTKGSQTDSITVKGLIAGDYVSELTGDIPANTSVTIFLKLNEGWTYQGQFQYRSSGDIVNGYRHYLDVVAISWPDMKIIGYHRLNGPAIPSSGTSGGGDIYWTEVSDTDVENWINSLPRS